MILRPAAQGYRLSDWQHVCAPTGLEGFRPAFLIFSANALPEPPAGGEQINLIAVAGTISVVAGRTATIRIGR
ncbi:MAG: hypothetical protein WCE61_01970, partial [Candidatus Acidiferrum sp.]